MQKLFTHETLKLSNKTYSVLIHIGAWLIMILPSMLLRFDEPDDFTHPRFIGYVFGTLFTIVNFYLFFSLLIPLLYDRKRIYILITITLLFLFIYPLLQYEVFSYIRDRYDLKLKWLRHRDYFMAQAYTSTLLYSGLAYLSRFTIQWVQEKQKQTELITQNQSSELALLRSQINPHFLFNTLNNIYSLVLKKSDNAPAAMMKLSEIMRYMLYETNIEKVPLEKEVKYLESYIELMQLRLKQKNFISFKVKGDISKYQITPMLLVPFVENALKHSNKKVKAPGITIDLKVEDNKLHYVVENYKKEECLEDVAITGGIGLQNINRRLELLYPEKHQLEITQEKDKFKIVLELEM